MLYQEVLYQEVLYQEVLYLLQIEYYLSEVLIFKGECLLTSFKSSLQ